MALKKDEKHLIELIVSGKDYPEAYSTVYPGSKKTKRTISACICRMLKRQDIQKYKAECERKIQDERAKIKDEVAEIIREKTLWSIQDSIDALKFVINAAKEDAIEIKKRNKNSDKYMRVMPSVTANPIIGAVERLNHMLGIEGQETGLNKSELTNQFIDATDFNEDPEDYKAPPILEVRTGEDDE